MKFNKPTEAELIAYLYGEMSEKEVMAMEEYLNSHPEERLQLKNLMDTRAIMQHVGDKEVIAPSIIESGASTNSIWQSNFFRIPMSIAASIALLIVVARVVGTELNYTDGTLTIRFGKSPATTSQNAEFLTQADVQNMIQSSLLTNNKSLTASWDARQQQLDEVVKISLRSNSKKVDDLIKVASQASQDQVRTFVAGLQSENLQMMKDYLSMSASDQKKYIEGLLVDFSKYLQEQRNQDLNLFQTRMASIERNTDQFKQETEQILASIISNPEASTKKNSY